MTLPTAVSQARFGPAAIAKHWAASGVGASRQYADKCIKEYGCPTSSLAEALKWRTDRTGKIASEAGEGGGAKNPPGRRDAPPGSMPDEIQGDSLEACLARARQTEMEQYRLWRLAVGERDASAQERALRNHAIAQKNVSEIEEKIFAHRKERGEYVLLPDAQARIDARLAQLRAAQTSFPRLLAIELAPGDAQRAEAKIKALQARHFNSPLAVAGHPLIAGGAVPATPPATEAAASVAPPGELPLGTAA